MITESGQLIVPAGSASLADLVVDMASVLRAEARQGEVATVTPVKAGELLAEFNHAWTEVHKLTALLEVHKNQAKKGVDRRRGVLLLEEIPKVLAAKGVASAADTREAVINTDEQYEQLSDRLAQIEAVLYYLKGKLKSFENSFTSVKKVMGEDSYNYGRGGRSISGDTTSKAERDTPPPPARTPSPYDTSIKPSRRVGFGTPKY